MKSFVGDEGGLDCFATKKWQKSASTLSHRPEQSGYIVYV